MNRKIYRTAAFFACMGCAAAPALAEDKFADSYPNFPRHRTTSADWDVTLGIGAGVGPRYEGSDDYSLYPVPYFEVVYKDRVTLDPTGLDFAILHTNQYDAGIGIGYDAGRAQDHSNNPFSTGDDKLRGLGTIADAFGPRIFGSYTLEPFEFNAAVTKFQGSRNNGILMTLDAQAALPVNNKLVLTPRLASAIADQSYTQTYFGVSTRQAARSGFPRFSTEGGVKDVSAGLNANYMLDSDQHWFVSSDLEIKQLVGDAAKSPITENATGVTFISFIGYHF